MADITMCVSIDCPMRETCYRAKAKPDPYWQSYSNFEYTCNENSGFDDYIKMERGNTSDFMQGIR